MNKDLPLTLIYADIICYLSCEDEIYLSPVDIVLAWNPCNDFPKASRAGIFGILYSMLALFLNNPTE